MGGVRQGEVMGRVVDSFREQLRSGRRVPRVREIEWPITLEATGPEEGSRPGNHRGRCDP